MMIVTVGILCSSTAVAGDLVADSSRGAATRSVRTFGGTSPLTIPAAAFASTGFTPDSYLFNTNGFISGTSSYGCLRAPAYLPEGAVVTRLAASMVDMNNGVEMSVSLIRTDNETFNSTTEMARVTSNGYTASASPNWYQDTSITVPEVDYPRYSYYVHACLPDYLFQLYQVEITFTDDVIFRDGFDLGGAEAWSSTAGGTVTAWMEPFSPTREVASERIGDVDAAGDVRRPDESSALGRGGVYGSPLMISPSEFKSDGATVGEVFIAAPTDGVMYGSNYDHERFMQAPVWLPNGVTITDVSARVVDNDAGGGGPANCASGTPSDIQLWLRRQKGCLATSCRDEMATASTSGALASMQFLSPSTIDFPVVDTDQYGYFLVVRLCGPKHEVYGVRITYTE